MNPEPDPEFDRQIAERVMGSPKHEWVDDIRTPGILDTYEGCRHCERSRKAERESEICVLAYSSDIAAAWKVVEKMGLRIGPILIHGRPWRSVTSEGTTYGTYPQTIWAVTHPGDVHVVLATHQNPCMAICQGALRALELLEKDS